MVNPIIRFSFNDIMKSIITLGQHYRDLKLSRDEEYEKMKKDGDFEYWPFKTKADFDSQLKKTTILKRKKKNKNGAQTLAKIHKPIQPQPFLRILA